jgi:hypothetical protein
MTQARQGVDAIAHSTRSRNTVMTQFAIERVAADPQASGNMGDMPVFRLNQCEQCLPLGHAQRIFGGRN